MARLVKAFERLPSGWRLALAGASQGYGAAEELRAVEDSPRRADIEFLGHLSGEQLAALYARARIFAFPSLDEGFGMPILEAMAHGVPVITSQCSAMPEVAGDAALLVDPLNIDQLAHALTRLAGDESLREDLIARGRARVRTSLGIQQWRKPGRSTKKLWARVCDLAALAGGRAVQIASTSLR